MAPTVDSLVEIQHGQSEAKSVSFFDTYNAVKAVVDKRILVVDDEEFCISTMRLLLQLSGVRDDAQVDYCITGQEALDKVRQALDLGIGYKLIFTDFNMPVMDGIMATENIIRCYQEQCIH